MQARIMREIIDPVVAGLARRGPEYRGFLYAGLMLTCDGPKVIEFNVRFGDPEAQVVIPLIDGELAPRARGCRRWRARGAPIAFRLDPHVGRRSRVAGLSGSGDRAARPIHGLDAASRTGRRARLSRRHGAARR